MEKKGYLREIFEFILFILLARLISLLAITVMSFAVRLAHLNDIEFIFFSITGILASAAIIFIAFYKRGRKNKNKKNATALLMQLTLSQILYFLMCLIFKFSSILSGATIYIVQSIKNNSEIDFSIYHDYMTIFIFAAAILAIIEILSAIGGYVFGIKINKKEKEILHHHTT